MICKKCNRELPDTSFKLTRWGTRAQVCTECATKARQETKESKRQEKEREEKEQEMSNRKLRLSEFTPRELMEELARRGYEGKLTYTETHIIDITDF